MNRRKKKRRIEGSSKIPDLGTSTPIRNRHWGSSDAEADEPRIRTIITEPQSMKQLQPVSQQQPQSAATAPIPNDIEQARHDAGLTLAEASKACRLAAKTIRQIERGTHPLSTMTMVKLSNGYGCSIGRLLCSTRATTPRIRKGRLSANPSVRGRARGCNPSAPASH